MHILASQALAAVECKVFLVNRTRDLWRACHEKTFYRFWWAAGRGGRGLGFTGLVADDAAAEYHRFFVPGSELLGDWKVGSV